MHLEYGRLDPVVALDGGKFAFVKDDDVSGMRDRRIYNKTRLHVSPRRRDNLLVGIPRNHREIALLTPN
jgi:hypothetical protein